MYVFDLDGTIALNEHRQHFVRRPVGEKDWDAFSRACKDDEPNNALIQIMWALKSTGYHIAILSGRGMIAGVETTEWLKKHNVPYDYIEMRSMGDHRDDRELKLEMIKRLETIFPDRKVHAIFDDRKKVVDMWRENGYNCYQVAVGDF